MSTKLISMNMGVRLHVMVDGQERTIEWSAVCPSESIPQPAQAIREILMLINETFGTELYVKADGYQKSDWNVEIAKPKKIKAPKYVSQDKYNKIIRELGQ